MLLLRGFSTKSKTNPRVGASIFWLLVMLCGLVIFILIVRIRINLSNGVLWCFCFSCFLRLRMIPYSVRNWLNLEQNIQQGDKSMIMKCRSCDYEMGLAEFLT